MDKIYYKNNETKIPKVIYNVKYKNGSFEGSGMILKFYELGFIKENQPLNADFLNKYHFELYIEEYLKCKKEIDYVMLGKKIFKEE